MGLRGKDLRCELDPELHDKLRVMADFQDQDLSRVAARLLEKAIAGEWHEFSLLRARLERSGFARSDAPTRGAARKGAE
jgi:hypothetical protein